MSDSSQSIAEARELIERAHAAWQTYRDFSQAQVDAIVDAMAAAATAHAERLAKLAVEETTYGQVADKIQKNLFASERVHAAIRGMRTVGLLREDRATGIIEWGVSMGVVAAILPCTNPTSTAIYKILIALKAGNAIVLSPHPAAMRCICETVGLMRQAAIAQGAPADLIGCFSTPTREGTQELMAHRLTKVILATGGMGIVKAAYSSGKPAFGVGPGNVPAFVDRSARLAEAVGHVVSGKSFDWGTICSSEQALVAETALREGILAELKKQNVYLMSAEEADALARVLIVPETFGVNPKCVGQAPHKLAAMAGFGDQVSDATRVLAAELAGMGKQFPLSAEKLSPVLALFFLADREACFQRCRDLLHFGGLGHTCVIHAQDEAVVREYGARMPAFRVVVNSPAPQGSIGATTNLFPAMTLGCG
ncbi:MAG: aldehyde dehydrogenase family protein, partial [Terriglobales bacterium]